jgi:hypothetical protein
VDYNPDVLTLDRIEGNGGSISIGSGDVNLDTGKVSWLTEDMENISVPEETLAVVTLTLKEDVAADTYQLGFKEIGLGADYGMKMMVTDGSAYADLTVKANAADPVNKADLEKAIADAQSDLDGTPVSEDGSDVEKTDKWVPQGAADAMKEAKIRFERLGFKHAADLAGQEGISQAEYDIYRILWRPPVPSSKYMSVVSEVTGKHPSESAEIYLAAYAFYAHKLLRVLPLRYRQPVLFHAFDVLSPVVVAPGPRMAADHFHLIPDLTVHYRSGYLHAAAFVHKALVLLEPEENVLRRFGCRRPDVFSGSCEITYVHAVLHQHMQCLCSDLYISDHGNVVNVKDRYVQQNLSALLYHDTLSRFLDGSALFL